MTKKEARNLARMNASALIETMSLDQLYGAGAVDAEDDANMQRMTDAQNWIAKLIRGSAKP